MVYDHLFAGPLAYAEVLMCKLQVQRTAVVETSRVLGTALFKEGCGLSLRARSSISSHLAFKRLAFLPFVKLISQLYHYRILVPYLEQLVTPGSSKNGDGEL